MNQTSKIELPTKFESANQSPGFLLWQVTTLWQRKLNATLLKYKLTHTQFVLLTGSIWLLKKEETLLTQIVLSDFTKVDPMVISQTIRLLEKKQLVIRKPHPQDTRAKLIEPTEKARKLIATVLPKVELIDSEFFNISKSEITILNHLFLKVLKPISKGS